MMSGLNACRAHQAVADHHGGHERGERRPPHGLVLGERLDEPQGHPRLGDISKPGYLDVRGGAAGDLAAQPGAHHQRQQPHLPPARGPVNGLRLRSADDNALEV